MPSWTLQWKQWKKNLLDWTTVYKNRRLERRRWAVYFNQGPLVSIKSKDTTFSTCLMWHTLDVCWEAGYRDLSHRQVFSHLHLSCNKTEHLASTEIRQKLLVFCQRIILCQWHTCFLPRYFRQEISHSCNVTFRSRSSNCIHHVTPVK